MKNYEISEYAVKGLIDYLETKPYKEVAPAIAALSQLKEVEKPKAKKDEDPKVLNSEK